MVMKFTTIETFSVRIPLKHEYLMITSLGVHDVSEYVIMRVTPDEGIGGWWRSDRVVSLER